MGNPVSPENSKVYISGGRDIHLVYPTNERSLFRVSSEEIQRINSLADVIAVSARRQGRISTDYILVDPKSTGEERHRWGEVAAEWAREVPMFSTEYYGRLAVAIEKIVGRKPLTIIVG